MTPQDGQVLLDLSATALGFLVEVGAVVLLALRLGRSWDRDAPPDDTTHGVPTSPAQPADSSGT